MQLVKIINLNEILKTIIDNISEVDIVTKFNFLGVMKKAEPYIQNFESVRSSLIEKYGEKNEDGQFFIGKESDNYESFIHEFEKLLNQEVKDFDVKIDKDDVFNKGIPSEYLVSLYDFIG